MRNSKRVIKQRNAPRILGKSQNANGNSQEDFKIGQYLLVCIQNWKAKTVHEPLAHHSPDTPDLTQQPTDTPISDRNDPSYHPPTRPSLGANSKLPGHTPRSLGCVGRPCLKKLKTRNICVLTVCDFVCYKVLITYRGSRVTFSAT